MDKTTHNELDEIECDIPVTKDYPKDFEYIIQKCKTIHASYCTLWLDVKINGKSQCMRTHTSLCPEEIRQELKHKYSILQDLSISNNKPINIKKISINYIRIPN